MASITLSNPTILATGNVCRFDLSAPFSEVITITNPTGIIFSVKSKGFLPSTESGTISRTVYGVGTPFTTGTSLYIDLSDPIYYKDNIGSDHVGFAPVVNCRVNAVTGGTNQSAVLSNTSCTNNSIIHYPRVIARFLSPAHIHCTGEWVEQVEAYHRFGVAAVKIGVFEATRIPFYSATGTHTYNGTGELIVWNNGTGIIAPQSILTGASGTRLVFINPDNSVILPGTLLSGNSSTTTSFASLSPITTGQVVTVTGKTLFNRSVFGPAARWDCFANTFNASNRGDGVKYTQGPGFRYLVAIPNIGDLNSIRKSLPYLDDTYLPGEHELYFNPDSLNVSSFKTTYTDPRFVSNYVNLSGTLLRDEYCLIKTTGSIFTIGIVANNASSSSGLFNFCPLGTNPDQIGTLAYQTNIGYQTGLISHGDMFTNRSNDVTTSTPIGTILEYSNGILTYVLHTTNNFAASDTIYIRTDYDFYMKPSGIVSNAYRARILSTPTVVSTGTQSGIYCNNGDTVYGVFSSGIVSITTTSSGLGHDTNTGTKTLPTRTIMRAAKLAELAHNDSAGSAIGDGATVKLKGGWARWGTYQVSNASDTRNFHLTVTHDEDITREDCRISRPGADGLRTNFIKLYDLILYGNFMTTTFIESNANPAGSFDRGSLWFDNCLCSGIARIGNLLWWSVTDWKTTYANSSAFRKSARGFIGTGGKNLECSQIGSDVFTQARCVSNAKAFELDSLDQPAFHSDIWQMLSTDGGRSNSIGHNIYVGVATGVIQIAPFWNMGITQYATTEDIAFVSFHQGPDSSTAISQMQNGFFNNCLFLHCTFGDRVSINNCNLSGVYFFGCYNDNYIEAAPLSGAFPYNHKYCHFRVPNNTYGFGSTSGNSLSEIFTQTDPTGCLLSNYYAPAPTSILLNRINTDQSIHIICDIYGRKLSTDSIAKPAVGSVQPSPVIQVSYDGTQRSDGDSFSKASGVYSLVICNVGPTGSVLELSDILFSGSVSGII